MLGALAALEADGRVVRGEFRPDGVRREWCDSEVLRQLRRRSLATLRREVEPVEPEALARFLPAWHGVPAQRRGVDAVVEALGLLAGAPIVASTLEADVLATRVDDYRPAQLDELCTSGDVVWVGAGAIGSNDGRVRLCFADQLALLAPGWEVQDAPDGTLHDAIRLALGERGASFWAPAAGGGARDAPTTSCSPRSGTSCGPERSPTTRSPRCGRSPAVASAARPPRRPLAGHGRAGSPASGRRPVPAGGASSRRCSTRCRRRPRPPTPWPCSSSSATACVTREAVLAEGVVGGYASVYGVLKVLEERGQVRRGYFVSGLGAAQFALPGAVDRLRQARERADDAIGTAGPIAAPVVLAATDPAQPYGGTLPWPDSAGPPGAHGRRAGRAPRRRADRLVRPPFAPPRDVPAHPRRPVVGRGARRPGARRPPAQGRAAQGRRRAAGRRRRACEAVTAAATAAGFADGYRGLTFSGR